MHRKVIIGAIAMAVAILLFIGYIRLTGTKGLRVSDTQSIADIPDRPSTGQGSRIDKTEIHTVQQARYTILDPDTKQVKRVFGFESLLNPGAQSNNWQVERPYMNVLEQRFFARLDAEQGAIQVDYSGGSVVPKDARLMGKVVIRLLPSGNKQLGETVILMDDLNYSSERSEFFTDGPVELISSQSRLLGKGMQMFYNPQSGRIEYFRVKEVQSIRIRKVVAGNLLGQSEAEKTETVVVSETAVEKTTDQPQIKTKTDSADTLQAKQEDKSDAEEKLYYKCSLRRDVRIRYGDQVIIHGADEINILNLLWGSQSSGNKNTSQLEPSGQTAVSQGTPAAQPAAAASPTRQEPQMTDDWNRRAESPPTPADDDQTDVVVTCRGSLVVMPIDSMFDPAKDPVASASQGSDSEQEDVVVEGQPKPARFDAQKLDYDLATGCAMADGPIRFLFYPGNLGESNDPNKPALTVPVVITAKKNAQFLAGSDKRTIKQVVFNEDVVGDATQEQPGDKTIRRFYGNKLTVDLAADADEQTTISHIAVTDGSPKLQAVRYRNGLKINHVELLAKQFDYEGDKHSIIAAGPGRIELNNKQAVENDATKEKRALDLRRPCYALVEGFDSLTWLTDEDRVLTDARKETLNLSYLPMIDETTPDADNLIRMALSNADLRFGRDSTDKVILSEVLADNGVYVEQRNKHVMMGQKMRYTGADGLLHIEGTENRPCFVDNARVPVIDYNLLTEKLKFQLSKTPGAINIPQD